MSILKNNLSKSKLSLTIQAGIKSIREEQTYAGITKPTECPELAKLINSILNSNFKVVIDPNLNNNANVSIPLIDKNNVMWKGEYLSQFPDVLEETATKDVYRASKDVLQGGIDESTGKLTGYFSKIESTITVSYDSVYRNEKWKILDSELTGIILHEIGHFVNFLRAIGWSTRTNYILHQAHTRMMGVGDVGQRVDILKDINDTEELKLTNDLDYLAKLNDPKTTTTVFVGGVGRAMRNELGADIYDCRGFEALSDDFAAAHGNGLDLIRALDKSPNSRMFKYDTAERLLVNVSSFSLLLGGIVFSPAMLSLVTLILLLTHNPTSKIYDDPKDRFARVSRRMIDALKGNRTKDVRALVKDIEEANQIVESYGNSDNFIETLYERLTSTGKESKSMRELNQVLEEFSSNKLYLAAAKYQNAV